MTREVHDIPPAPRHVRWRAVLWHRWPLALLAMLLGGYGSLIALMLNYAAGGKPHDDVVLDTQADITEGRVVAVHRSDAKIEAQPAEWIEFEYELPTGDRLTAHCFARRGEFVVSPDPVDVEFLADRPHKARLAGTRISLLGNYAPFVLGIAVFPGLLLLLLWLQGVFDLRRIMTDGYVAVAELEAVRQLRLVNPTMLEVHYRFRDHRAQLHEGRHWVRARSELGQRLTATPERLALVHDRHRPQRSRLVIPSDFLPPAVTSVEENVRL